MIKIVSSESARLQDLQSAGMDVLKPHLQHQSLGFKESPCPLLYYVSWWQPWSERPPVSNQHESGESQLRSHAKRLAVELRRLRSRAASAVAADGAPSAQSLEGRMGWYQHGVAKDLHWNLWWWVKCLECKGEVQQMSSRLYEEAWEDMLIKCISMLARKKFEADNSHSASYTVNARKSVLLGIKT